MTRLTYSDYLQLDILLSLQTTRTPDSAKREVILAEHFFVVAHQSCELWLKQIVGDLEAAADALLPEYGSNDAESSLELLQRAAELLRVLHEQIMALEKLPVRHFVEFRPYLGSASGAESKQFRYLADLLGDDQHSGRLYEAFTAATVHAGMLVAEVCRRGPDAGVYHRIAEVLMDIGNAYWRWKVAHLTLISKMLGDRSGTGGTSGAMYLAGRISLPFSELRQLRGQLHDDLARQCGGLI